MIYAKFAPVGLPDISSSTMKQTLKSSVASTSRITQPQQHNSNTKTCRLPGCAKGAGGASGLCITHGGGWRCRKAGCHRVAEGRTIFCKAHGGGEQFQYLGCTKSAEGRTDYCIAHGGGCCCCREGCTRAARGKSGLCIRHGGGKRCQKENCTKSAKGCSGLCISQGGGRCCKYPERTKGARDSTNFCKAHGGGKGAYTWVAQKGLKEAHPSARRMVEGSTVHFKVVAQSVCMVVPSSVLLMVVGKGVLYGSALKVPGEGQITVFVMVVERDARLRVAERVLRAALISAKHMGEISIVLGANLGQILVLVAPLVTILLEGRLPSVLHTLPW